MASFPSWVCIIEPLHVWIVGGEGNTETENILSDLQSDVQKWETFKRRRIDLEETFFFAPPSLLSVQSEQFCFLDSYTRVEEINSLSPWTLSLLDVSWWLSLHSSSKLFSYQTSFALFLQERRHRLFSSQEGFHLTILKSLTGEFTFAVIPFLVNCISLWFPIFLFKWNLLLEFCCQVKSVTKSLRSRRVSCMTQSSLLR